MATRTSFLPSRNASMAFVRSSWSGEGQADTVGAATGWGVAGRPSRGRRGVKRRYCGRV